jgi:uncharacterized protein (TIGR03435 family)
MRIIPGLLVLALSLELSAQNSKTRPSFEVASVKRAAEEGNAAIFWSGTELTITELTITGYSPRMLIAWAYDVRDDRLIGKSKWLDAVPYDIIAKPAEAPGFGELQLMMESLLQARFGLAVHHEKRDLPFYALVIARIGEKFRLSDGCLSPATSAGRRLPRPCWRMCCRTSLAGPCRIHPFAGNIRL